MPALSPEVAVPDPFSHSVMPVNHEKRGVGDAEIDSVTDGRGAEDQITQGGGTNLAKHSLIDCPFPRGGPEFFLSDPKILG